jgi:hypothetical protein
MAKIDIYVSNELRESFQFDGPENAAKQVARACYEDMRSRYSFRQLSVRVSDADGNTLFAVNEGPLGAAVTHTGRSAIRLALRLLLTIVMGGAVLAIMRSCK